MNMFFVFFFKQKTAYEMRISDWSSDVCSSDLKRRDEITMPAMQFHAVQPRSLRAIGCDGEMLDHHSDVVDRHGTIIDRSYLAEIGPFRLLRQIDAVIAAGDQLRRRGDIDGSARNHVVNAVGTGMMKLHKIGRAHV